jgi:hypothetical protein
MQSNKHLFSSIISEVPPASIDMYHKREPIKDCKATVEIEDPYHIMLKKTTDDLIKREVKHMEKMKDVYDKIQPCTPTVSSFAERVFRLVDLVYLCAGVIILPGKYDKLNDCICEKILGVADYKYDENVVKVEGAPAIVVFESERVPMFRLSHMLRVCKYVTKYLKKNAESEKNFIKINKV